LKRRWGQRECVVWGENVFWEKVGSRKWWVLDKKEDVSQGKGGLEEMMGPKEKMFPKEKVS